MILSRDPCPYQKHRTPVSFELQAFFDNLESWPPFSSRCSTRFGFVVRSRASLDLEILALRHQVR
jgi:hypothetical protein